MDHLISLQEGDHGFLEVVAIGRSAIPRLRALLFEREPSGMFQPRCRAVDALAVLGAREVLVEFISVDRAIHDPVERAGEDAVINAVARALRNQLDEPLVQRLLLLAERDRLPGPIEVLGAMRCKEALPALISTLGDDVSGPVAKEAIKQFGNEATEQLLAAAELSTEVESSLRRRRLVVALLFQIADSASLSDAARARMLGDADPAISVLGARIALRDGDTTERERAAKSLVSMLPRVNWMIRHDIETCLLSHPHASRPAVQAALPATPPAIDDFSAKAAADRVLLRVARFLHSQSG